MKKLLFKIIILFAFVLVFISNVIANELNISSIVYDNSMSFLVINSMDADSYEMVEKPKITIVEDEKKAFFDIPFAKLNTLSQDLVLSEGVMKEIVVRQLSTNPNVVRVEFFYNEGFNPEAVRLKKLNNTLFVIFNSPIMQNYYFQHLYAETSKSINPVLETLSIETPVLASQKNILGQINSAFNLNSNTQKQDYVLVKKDLFLQSKFYLDNITASNEMVRLTGVGGFTVLKPISLSNPERVAFDIPNAIVNPSIRNKEIAFTDTETIRAGQFDKSTTRIVITGKNAKYYVPVIYGDNQQIIFFNKNKEGIKSLFSTYSTLRSINDEINDIKNHSLKFVFSKPLVYGFEKSSDLYVVHLFNVDKLENIDLKTAFLQDNVSIEKTKGGWYKILVKDTENIDTHIGADAKTLRLKIKNTEKNVEEKNQEPVIIVEPVVPKIPARASDKKYIVLDAGHGGSDCGATRNGIFEKDINLDITKRVENILVKKGYEVYMTRVTDDTVSLEDRVEISENIMPDIFVSIHVNSSNSETPNGIETHYYKDNSLRLAKTVHASMLNNIKAYNRGLFKSKFYVINHTTAPAILVEIGFISNPTERAQLVSESRKQATAKAIAEGIDGYFK